MSGQLTTRQIIEYTRLRAGASPLHFARAFRIMPDGLPYGIFSEPHFMPYIWGPYEAMRQLAPAQRLVVMKCAQSGWTETALNLMFWFLATKKENVMYMLPGEGQLGDFAQARITQILNLSPKIKEAFSAADNVGLKIGWDQALYLRGANSTTKLREIPIGLLIRDEFDAMDKEGRDLARSRLGASRYKWIYDLANPSFPESGIHKEFLGGTQEEYTITCQRCRSRDAPKWPESAGVDPDRLLCPSCGATLNLRERWEKKALLWVPKEPGALYRSWTMNQLIAPMTIMSSLHAEYKEAQYDNSKLQIFHNMVLGEPFSAAGARIDDSVISKLVRRGAMVSGHAGPCVMGVDVGKLLYVQIRRSEGGIIWAGTTDWDGLPRLMHSHNIQACGMDIRPETAKAKDFAKAFGGRVTLIAYNPNAGATGKIMGEEDGVRILTVGRTEAIDSAFARLFSGEEEISDNLPDEFWAHFKSMTRQVVRQSTKQDTDRAAKEFASWIESGDDHYAHAFVYSELVRPSGSPWSRAQIFPPEREGAQEEHNEKGNRLDMARRQEGFFVQGFRNPEGWG